MDALAAAGGMSVVARLPRRAQASAFDRLVRILARQVLAPEAVFGWVREAGGRSLERAPNAHLALLDVLQELAVSPTTIGVAAAQLYTSMVVGTMDD